MTISNEIFKVDTKGKIRTWQYEVHEDSWRTIAGLQDGNKVTSAWTKCVPASQPTAELQAQFEADAEQKKKLKRDYHLTIAGTATANYFKPMLAEKYEPHLVQPGDMAQPKLDGIRCIATKDGLRTRKGEALTSCPHIIEQLDLLFTRYPDLTLDGELYNHDLKDNFNELASIIRKKTPDTDQVARAARDIEYHVYDLVSGGDFASEAVERNGQLTKILLEYGGDAIIPVDTIMVDTDAEVRSFFKQCVALGYEGAMVRSGGAGYQQKRSKALLKFKEFQTAEYPVSRVIEGTGNWAGYAKAVEYIMPGDVRGEDGERPKAGIKGDYAFTKALLDRDVEIVTVRFFELTPAGVPRFGIAIDFDRRDA
ncbi:ATP-dependent DNA ligase [Rhizobium arsenicireducens]